MKTGIIVALFGALSLTTVGCKDKGGTPETVAPDTAAPTETTPTETPAETPKEGEGEEADAE
ncbi:MAG: hypothetical protein IPK80_05920 [Nannocystis sp.]|nr:hypothetical protein [Nannocystis sp.]